MVEKKDEINAVLSSAETPDVVFIDENSATKTEEIAEAQRKG